MSQSPIYQKSTISDDFYGNPTSMYDFPLEVVVCKCRYTCLQSCSSYRNYVRRMLYHMHTAITELGLWGEFIKNSSSKSLTNMFTNVKWIIDINSHPLVYKDSHSDDSFALSMQYMNFIATNGWNSFVKGLCTSKINNNILGYTDGPIYVIIS